MSACRETDHAKSVLRISPKTYLEDEEVAQCTRGQIQVFRSVLRSP